jgi:hypothetical protein
VHCRCLRVPAWAARALPFHHPGTLEGGSAALICLLKKTKVLTAMTTESSNNARLQTLVRPSGLTQAVALTIFNRPECGGMHRQHLAAVSSESR